MSTFTTILCRLCQMKHHVLLHPTRLQSTNHNLEVKHALVDKNVVEHASTREHKEINTTLLPTEKVDVLRKSQLEVTSSTEVIVKASHSVAKGVVKQATSAASSNDELSQACISTSHCQLTLTSALVQTQSESGLSKEELTILLSKKKVVVLSYLPSNCDGVTSSGTSNKDKKSLKAKIRAQGSNVALLSCSNQKLTSLGDTSSCKGVADKGVNTSIQKVAVSSGLGGKRKETCEVLPNKELNKNYDMSMVGGNSYFFIPPTDGAIDGVKKFMSNSRYSPQRVEAKKNVESDQILCNFIISVIESVTSVQMAIGRISKTLEKHTEQRAKLMSFHRTRIKKLLHDRLRKRKCRSRFTQKFSSTYVKLSDKFSVLF
ncbi:uncharacterized protein [Choristoneura fumiferana]|uniref:uncharacterized protein n=1 Tax=Choristoneura fumiferana TaxID=7141 RepID=UPI003D15CE80